MNDFSKVFYSQDENPVTFLRSIAKVLRTSTPARHRQASAEVWVPAILSDSNAAPYLVVTCRECFHTFTLTMEANATNEVITVPCFFCSREVSYSNDFSRRLHTLEQEAA